jgi:hypothetical protein
VAFADRFKEAAEAARSIVQEPGIIGGLDAIRGTQALPVSDHDLDVARRAMGRGAPDPYTLITHDEVTLVTGIPVGGPSLTYADDDLGVRFCAEDGHRQVWSFGVHAGHAVDDGTLFDPERWFRWMVALLDQGEPVPDLGDAAVYQSGLLYVLGQGRAFYVLVQAPDGSPLKGWSVAVARRVLERFASGDAR